MKRTIFTYLLFSLLMPAAHAAEPDVLTFVAPTTYKDGSAIPSGTAMSFNIYQGLQGQPKVMIATITTTGTTVTTGLVPGSTYCFAATAVIAGVEGAQNADVADDPLTPAKEGNCKLTPLLVPGSIVVTVR